VSALVLAATSLELRPVDLAGNQVQLLALLAGLSLVPFAVMMLTSFSKVIVVLSVVRSALGTQQAPPTMVLTGLAVVLSATIMTPTFEQLWANARAAREASTGTEDLLTQAPQVLAPLRDFLVKHGSPDERAHFVDLARELRPQAEASLVSEDDLTVVVPAFVLTELKEAFIISFLVFLPFLVVDMLIANVLLALGMQSLSPSQVSLPFKLLLFVSVDGWALLSRGLVLGYR
jgi:type III secretion protein R